MTNTKYLTDSQTAVMEYTLMLTNNFIIICSRQ